MVDRLDLYDLLSVLVPGAIVVGWIPLCWPDILLIAHPVFPEAFTVILLIALSMVVGQVTQSISGAIEKLHDWTFGGKADALLMEKKLKAVNAELIDRVRSKIISEAGAEMSDDAAFLYAQEQARSVSHSRTERFNALYAYNRNLIGVLLIMILNFSISMVLGGVQRWPYQQTMLGVLGTLLLIQWFRARRRAEYFVREVLVTCETALDSRVKS